MFEYFDHSGSKAICFVGGEGFALVLVGPYL